MKCIDFIKFHNIYFNHFKTMRVLKVLTREAISYTRHVDNYGATSFATIPAVTAISYKLTQILRSGDSAS